MEFKIDTKDNYSRISTTAAHIDANMAAALEARCQGLADNGSTNFLVVLSSCQSGEESGFEALAAFHENCYSEGRSLVFAALTPEVTDALEEAQLAGALNIAPTEQEAIDIIHMEILERDLMDEEG